MKQAFTLIELIFVIVLISILGASAMFYFRSSDNEIAQAANQLARHIRYTQHLALMDDRFDPSDNKWYGERWQIRFFYLETGDRQDNRCFFEYYAIFSDRDEANKGGLPDTENELATDPYDKRRLGVYSGEDSTKSITHLRANYNTCITHIYCPNSINSSTSFAFDSIGRPYFVSTRYDEGVVGAYAGLQREECRIELTHLDTNQQSEITIHPETGLVTVSY